MRNSNEQQLPSNPPESSCSISSKCLKPLTRDEIKVALKKVYKSETKPVNVGSIRVRTGLAYLLIILGTIMIAGILIFKLLALELSIMIYGFLLLLTTFSIGFLLSTKNIRKIFKSMSRFKDYNIPSYRTILPKSTLRSQSIIYATLLCLILVGAQAINFQIITNNNNLTNNQSLENQVEYKDGTIWLDDLILGEAYESSGQYYRKIIVEINNSIHYYGSDLVLELKSYFAGDEYDELTLILDEPNSDIRVAPMKIHEPDDTTIFANLKHFDGKKYKLKDQLIEKAENDIYITSAKGKITKTSPITKSIDITAIIYNEGMIPRVPEEVSVIITTPGFFGDVYRDSVKNNETIEFGEFWEVRFKFDIRNDESEFNVELKIDEKTKDIAMVLFG